MPPKHGPYQPSTTSTSQNRSIASQPMVRHYHHGGPGSHHRTRSNGDSPHSQNRIIPAHPNIHIARVPRAPSSDLGYLGHDGHGHTSRSSPRIVVPGVGIVPTSIVPTTVPIGPSSGMTPVDYQRQLQEFDRLRRAKEQKDAIVAAAKRGPSSGSRSHPSSPDPPTHYSRVTPFGPQFPFAPTATVIATPTVALLTRSDLRLGGFNTSRVLDRNPLTQFDHLLRHFQELGAVVRPGITITFDKETKLWSTDKTAHVNIPPNANIFPVCQVIIRL
jgi:hypothetical protein